MSSPDSVPTPQFDSLYALSQSTHAMAIGKDFFEIITAPTSAIGPSECGWCTLEYVRGTMSVLDCQQCGASKNICVVCRMDADAQHRAGPAAGMCAVASRGCLECTTPGFDKIINNH